MRKLICIFIFISVSGIGLAQDTNAWFYLRAKDSLFNPTFSLEEGKMIYKGDDARLAAVLRNHSIFTFKKTFRKAKKENLKKTFFVVSESESLLEELLENAPHIFEFGELIQAEEKKIFEPNDYGLTSTIGENLGNQANLDYYDFLDVPKAWYYTTGSRETIIGISDGTIDTTDADFKGKTRIHRKSGYGKGHGISVASIAAGQGDNAYGVPGVCFDCSIYATIYGDYKNLAYLLELSNLGVRVINCSWVGSTYNETTQAVIDEIFSNGTVLVAAAGNTNWIQNKYGEKRYYPASYNNVISVSTAHYKNETAYDDILTLNDSIYYADNIRHHVGRTMGFVDNDPTKQYKYFPVSIATINSDVDIAAPSAGILLYASYVKDKSTKHVRGEATSPAAPLVTGAIGLMFSLNPCLPVDEVESILKITSVNIDYVKHNKPYKGMYGSGALNIGSAVKMVYDLASPNSTSYIEKQNFSRWNFKLTALSKEVVIRNQKFVQSATLDLRSKNSIIIGENTVLRPNVEGSISLKIDPSLEKNCELQLRDPSIENRE